jgi:NitT/TauT family transport system substrate-binding protein
MAGSFLREEGFTGEFGNMAYTSQVSALMKGEADIGISFANTFVGHVDAGQPLIALAAIHPGCAEVWAKPGIATIGDLKGKTVAVNSKTFTFNNRTSPEGVYSFYVSLLGYVGIAPSAVNFVEIGATRLLDAFLDGSTDAYLAQAEGGVLLRANARNPGKLILDTTIDKPWSQIQCCLLVANRDWQRANPVAAKRATRAILRAADAAAKDKRAAARAAIAGGVYTATPAITEQVVYDTIKDLSFDWREYDAEDALRTFALRMGEAKLIGRTPQEIVNVGADFAYFRQLRKELRA